MSEETISKICRIGLLVVWLVMIAGAARVRAANCYALDNPEMCSDVYNSSGSSGGCAVYFDQVYCSDSMQYCDIQQTLCEGTNWFSIVIACSCY